MANIKSQIKRITTNEKARQRNQAIRSSVETAIRKVREAAEAGDKAKAVELQRDAAQKPAKAPAPETRAMVRTASASASATRTCGTPSCIAHRSASSAAARSPLTAFSATAKPVTSARPRW